MKTFLSLEALQKFWYSHVVVKRKFHSQARLIKHQIIHVRTDVKLIKQHELQKRFALTDFLFIFFHVFGVNSKMLFRRNKANSKGEKLIMKGCVYIGRKPNGWRVSEDNYNIFSCRTIEMLNDSSANDIAQRLAFEKTSFVNRNLSLSRPFRHDLHKFTQQILHRDNEKANADV